MNNFAIKLAGTDVGSKIDIIDIDIQYRINDIPCLRLSILETSIRDQDFEIVKGKDFKLGKEITVSVLDAEAVLFKGIITGLSIGKKNDTYIEIEAYGDAIKMSDGLVTKLYKSGTTDDQLITDLMTISGVTMGDVAKSDITHYQYFSYQVTPWRLMMARIFSNGFIFSSTTESSSVVNIQTYAGAEKKIDIQENGVIDFNFKQDVRSQIKNISTNSWDITQQKIHNAKGVQGKKGKFTSHDKADEVLAIPDMVLFSNFTKSPKELEAQATAQNNYRLLDSNQGSLTLETKKDSDFLTLKLMDTVSIENLGKDFSGKYIVSGIRHYLISGEWRTDIDFGISLTQTLQSEYVHLPDIPMMSAKVVKYKPDEEEIERLPVQLPALPDNDLIWARPLSPFASNGEGIFFPPNIGDEVIVNFIDGDCRYPVILGACHNPKLKPPQELKEEKPIRGIFIKQKDEEVPISVVFDKSSDKLKLSSGKGEINLSDAKGSEFIMEEDIVSILKTEIACEKPMSIASKDEITITTDKKLVVKAQATELS